MGITVAQSSEDRCDLTTLFVSLQLLSISVSIYLCEHWKVFHSFLSSCFYQRQCTLTLSVYLLIACTNVLVNRLMSHLMLPKLKAPLLPTLFIPCSGYEIYFHETRGAMPNLVKAIS